jgi:uncharacterized protein
MKFALFVLAIVVLLWLLRSTVRRRMPPPAEKSAPADAPSTSPQPMLTCAHCGLHLPRDEALPGRGGVFCGDAHRKAFEQAHPGS